MWPLQFFFLNPTYEENQLKAKSIIPGLNLMKGGIDLGGLSFLTKNEENDEKEDISSKKR